jgi:glutaredoxin
MTTVPQVFIDGERIGGSEEVETYLNEQVKNAA